MINLCLVVIATQFSETKQREHRLMLEQRQRYLSSSTVASYAEPGDCYEEIFQYVCHILRKAKRRALGLYQALQSRRQALSLEAPAPAKPGPHAKEPRHYNGHCVRCRSFPVRPAGPAASEFQVFTSRSSVSFTAPGLPALPWHLQSLHQAGPGAGGTRSLCV
ncbi:Voltage-dependent T-type calcium channel subunit alpha-1I [Saguinus oedipus]|uniref:Voltage-dependent T-type calcium channel subunit alpha-1I n=1 Tax=Saguinus oedipus TaxID=9490 RepID=A0ABQ9WHF9_SAGOE|nr:Voltage-dependent T-type calcium channel subunit alpha-1I [Saguinus oedipus]